LTDSKEESNNDDEYVKKSGEIKSTKRTETKCIERFEFAAESYDDYTPKIVYTEETENTSTEETKDSFCKSIEVERYLAISRKIVGIASMEIFRNKATEQVHTGAPIETLKETAAKGKKYIIFQLEMDNTRRKIRIGCIFQG